LTAAQQQQAAAAQAAGAAAQVAATQTVRLSSVQTAAATAASRLAAAQGEVVGASTAVAAAQVTLTRASAAVAAAEKAVGLAVATNNTALVAATQNTLTLAKAQQVEAVAALSAARAQAAHAATLGSVSKAGLASGASLLGLRGAVLTAGGAFLGATIAIQSFSKSLQLAANFETQLNVFQVTAGATADEMERVSTAARELGRDITLPGVAASDAAETLTELAKAGLTVNESLNAVRGTLQLATAAQISNAQATELVANALNTFQLPGREAVRVADLLAAASSEAQGSILDMGLALKQVAPVATGLGLSIQDTVTLLTQLARSGLSSSDAGTSLRQALLRLVQDMPKVQKTVRELGLALRDQAGNIRPELFGELGAALLRLAPAERQAAVAALGGADAIRAYILLARDGAAEFDRVAAAVTEAGAAQELASAQTKGLAGDAEALKNEMSELGLTVGQVAAGPVSLLTQGLTALTGALNDSIEAAGETGVWEEIGRAIGDLPGVFTRIGIAMRGGALSSGEANDEFSRMDAIARSLKGSLDGLATAFDGVTKALAPVAAREGRGLFLGPSEKGDIAAILAGGTEGLDDDIAAARARLDRINARLEDFHGNRNQFAALMKEQADAQADLNRLVNQRASQAEAAAKAAASAAQREASAAQQEFLARQQTARAQAENRVAAAALTPSLKDDIARQEDLLVLIRQQIAQAKKRIKDRAAQAAVVAALRALEIRVLNDIAQLNEDVADKQQQIRDQATGILGKRLRLAELRGDRDLILEALNAAIADARKRVKAAKTVSDRLDEQIALQELINQKKEILAEETKAGARADRSLFEFLQAQQGFAANLLSNLIPGFATAGLVGGTSGPTVPEGAGVLPRTGTVPVDFGLQAQAGVAEARSQGGPTSGQAQTTNGLLSRILRELVDLNQADKTPEATRQKRRANAAMDGVGGG
jgi:TP901 family phage tail tape measure protein